MKLFHESLNKARFIKHHKVLYQFINFYNIEMDHLDYYNVESDNF